MAKVVQLLNIQIMKGVLKVVAWLTETKDESQSPNRKIPNKALMDLNVSIGFSLLKNGQTFFDAKRKY